MWRSAAWMKVKAMGRFYRPNQRFANVNWARFVADGELNVS